ncbi:cyclic nucleotide-binding domain-containing protein, partial [Brunnivagina elsteri]
MTTSINIYHEFLAKIAPFDKLDSTVLDGIVNKLEPLRYRMGQAILVKENLPARIAILYDGQARLLGYPPGAIAPQTLEKLEPGAIIGATSIIRGVPCETAIASTETVCLTLKVSDFLDLLREEGGRG